jgi:CHAP domain/Dockerin type I domain
LVPAKGWLDANYGLGAWLAGKGVPVCSDTNGTTCAGQAPVGGVSGAFWQCVELAQRLYKSLGWYTKNGGVFQIQGQNGQLVNLQSAYQIYDDAAELGMTAYPYNSGYLPVPGDMIVHSSADGGGSGHVAIVDSWGSETNQGYTLNVVEENVPGDNHGRGTYILSTGGTLTRTDNGLTHILGTVHSPLNAPPRQFTLKAGSLKVTAAMVDPLNGTTLNASPKFTTRPMTVTILDSNGSSVYSPPQVGAVEKGANYTGTIALPKTWKTGQYEVRVQLNGTLTQIVEGRFGISSTTNVLPPQQLFVGDVDGNDVINILDYNLILDCMNNQSDCTPVDRINADLNDDGVVNPVDLNLFQRTLVSDAGTHTSGN